MGTLTEVPQYILWEVLDGIQYPDIDKFCGVNWRMQYECMNDMYWQHRLTEEFGIPSMITDTRQTFDEVYHCRAPDKIGECALKAAKRNEHRFVEFYIDYIIRNNIGNVQDPVYAAGILARTDLLDRMIKHFGADVVQKIPMYANVNLRDTFLEGAAEGGHRKLVNSLIRHEDDQEEDVRYAFRGAIKGGHRDLVFDLIEKGARNLDIATYTAARHCHRNLVFELINKMSTIAPGSKPISITNVAMAAAGGGCRDFLFELIDRYADIGADLVLKSAAMSGRRDLINELFDNGFGDPKRALWPATSMGHRDILDDVLDRVKLIDSTSQRRYYDEIEISYLDELLKRAAGKGHSDIVLDLIDRGASDLDGALFDSVKTYMYNEETRNKAAITFIAIFDRSMSGNPNALGIVPTVTNEGLSRAADNAVKNGHIAIIKELIERGIVDPGTALELAKRENAYFMTAFLKDVIRSRVTEDILRSRDIRDIGTGFSFRLHA